jgi:energy-coupling factor transporter ATP-binding protein EcfA2
MQNDIKVNLPKLTSTEIKIRITDEDTRFFINCMLKQPKRPILIHGGVGSGKTTLMKLLAEIFIMRGRKILVLNDSQEEEALEFLGTWNVLWILPAQLRDCYIVKHPRLRIEYIDPEKYEKIFSLISKAKEEAKRTGCKIRVTNDPKEAVKRTDIVYTDVWASMGQEKEHEQRVKVFKPYQVNAQLVKEAKEDYLFMHCLPAHRGEEVTDEVADSKNSVIFDQAENRMHTQKALLALIM